MKKRNEIRRTSVNRHKHFEKKYAKPIAKAIYGQIKDVTSILRHSGINAAQRWNDNVLMNERLSPVISDLYKTVGVFYANDTYRNIKEQVKSKGFGFNQDWIAELLNYFRLYLLSQAVVPITETTKEIISRILQEGEQNGWGIDKMVAELENTDLTAARAQLIVRTEIAKAAFKGREMAYEKIPYKLEFEWVTAEDFRVRHSHRIMDGVKIEEGGRFKVPIYTKRGKVEIFQGYDLMKGPGDPNAHKSNVINCRCTISERVMFADDEPVMKDKVRV